MIDYEKRKKTYKPSLLIVLAIIIVVAMIAQLTFLSLFGTRGKEVASIREQQKELIMENEILEAEIAKKQSLARVKKIATEELGMVQVGEIEYITPSGNLSAQKP